MRMRPWTAGLVLVPMLLTGCSTSTPAARDEPVRVTPADPAGPRGTGRQEPAATGPLVKTTLKITSELKADVVILEMRRRGKLLNLVMSVTARMSDGTTFINMSEVTSSGETAVTLVDPVNLKRHLIVRDSNGTLLQPQKLTLEIGVATTLSYTYAAPPEAVTAMDVVIGGSPPIRDVPVQP